MSLDVYLYAEHTSQPGSGIFVRDGGETKEISRAEWDEKFPGREPIVVADREGDEPAFHANITHNLNRMATEAGIYDCLWCPDENGITTATQLIEPLERGLALMKADPERFKKHNPSNGWGSYDSFVPWIERYLAACKEFPTATVSASR